MEIPAAEPSHFFRLPAELRDDIYRLVVLDRKRPTVIFTVGRPAGLKPRPTDVDLRTTTRPLQSDQRLRGPQQPALALVSRQLRHEVLPLFYGEQRAFIQFTLAISPGSTSAWWMQSPPFAAAARYLRNLTIWTHVTTAPMASAASNLHQQKGIGFLVVSTVPGSDSDGRRMLGLECEGDLEARCCCKLRTYVDGLNAAVAASGAEGESRSLMFLRWVAETVVGALRKPYDAEDMCEVCDK